MSSICNISISKIDGNFKSLPRPTDSTGVIAVILERKVEYRRDPLFELVRTRIIEYLRANR